MTSQIKQYLLITLNYWFFTLSDGALRMLIVLYFYQLGYDALTLASLFLFYEFFGVVTNLIGGWLGAKFGLNRTMNLGLGLQVIALGMLAVPEPWLSIVYVMFAQALSGIAKDLNKMSAKSSVKMLISSQEQGRLFKWIALLTGSKNTLKGLGFFVGGGLLASIGFQYALAAMAATLLLVFIASLVLLKADIGKSKSKPKFKQLFSKSKTINVLSAARLFLFASRDIWFVIAIPVYFASEFDWPHWQTGSFMAAWVIIYGLVQAVAPKLTGINKVQGSHVNLGRKHAFSWALPLTLCAFILALLSSVGILSVWVLIIGLFVYGCFFALNSSLHSYLIVKYASEDGVSLDVGFYYMANAMGRLIGTVLSGSLFLWYGLSACLWFSCLFLLITCFISLYLPAEEECRP